MKHFRLIFVTLLVALIGLTAVGTVFAVSGRYAPAALAGIGAAVLCAMLWNRVDKLKMMIWTFAKSLDENDTSSVFETETDDPVLRETLEEFNQCMHRYHRVSMDLETRKLYYDRILKVMSHEMGNGITPVISLCSDIRKHPDRYTGARLAEAIELIDSRSRSINRFLKAYYSLTHIPGPEKTNVDSREFMTRVKKLVDFELESRGLGSEVCRYRTSAVTVLGIDPGLMEQVMVNLVRNALDAVATVDNPQVSVTLSVSDGKPYIMVEDNGAGIDPAVRDSLFQPFVTTKPEGTGVGLYLSRQIIRRHGGDLRLMGTAGHGVKAVVEFS